jgi:hypothetical protein
MSNEQNEQPGQPDNQQAAGQADASQQQQQQPDDHADFDGLANKKPEELTPEELRLMADTMPGDGPGD